MGFVFWWKGEPPPSKQDLFDSFQDMPFILKILTLQLLIPGFYLYKRKPVVECFTRNV